MKVSRRQFMKYCMGAAAGLGMGLSGLGTLEKALAEGQTTVIWLNGANCTGCTISLANRFDNGHPKEITDLLISDIKLAFHPNLMGAAGTTAVQNLKNAAAEGNYVLAVEGGIPTAFDGATCVLWSEGGADVTALQAVQMLAPSAKAVLCIGTCSSFGGIPAGYPNRTGIKSVSEVTGVPTINIPGCPTHPDWIVWTIARLIAGRTVYGDEFGRPTYLFSGERRNVHERCPRLKRARATNFGQEGLCLRDLGCKGPRTQASCPSVRWNNGANWCVGANGVCIGCTEKGFPDSFSPFYTPDPR